MANPLLNRSLVACLLLMAIVGPSFSHSDHFGHEVNKWLEQQMNRKTGRLCCSGPPLDERATPTVKRTPGEHSDCWPTRLKYTDVGGWRILQFWNFVLKEWQDVSDDMLSVDKDTRLKSPHPPGEDRAWACINDQDNPVWGKSHPHGHVFCVMLPDGGT